MAYKEIDESNITLIDSVSSFIEMIKQVKETRKRKTEPLLNYISEVRRLNFGILSRAYLEMIC